MKYIALVDCNNFFVSCEILFNPTLAGKPVCVLSNNDGCVVARSNEAKKLGITMGMPHFMAKVQYPQAIYLSGNHPLYNDISSRIMKRLYDFTPNVEQYSVDEAFLDLSGTKRLYHTTYQSLIEEIRLDIKNHIGIPVSIGLGGSKVQAKLASELAKKNGGIFHITQETQEKILKNTPLEDVWGIGRNTASMLRGYMMRSAYDFCSQNDAWVKRVWGVVGLEIKHELLGESLNPVIDGVVLPKSIQKTASFAKFTSDKEFIRNSLYYHCHRACTKLRKLEMKAQSFGIMLRTKDFRILSTEAITLPYPTDSELELNRVISKLFSRVFESNLVYRSSGVYVGKLIQNNALQLSLLRGEDSKRAEKISRVWDKIDKKYGKGKISLGRSGVLNMQNDET